MAIGADVSVVQINRPLHEQPAKLAEALPLQQGNARWLQQRKPAPSMTSNLTEPPTQPFSSTTPRQSRNRVIHTCLPCHRAKRKCNRKKPCSQCLKRQVTGSCVYEAIAAEDLESLQAEDSDLSAENHMLRARIADLEATLAGFREQLRDSKNNGSRKRQRTQSDLSIAREPDKDDVYYGRSYYLGGPAAPDLLRRMMSLVPNDQSDMLFAFSGSSNVSHSPASPGVYMFPTLFSADHGVKEMLSILVGLGRPLSDRLLDAYYHLVDPLHHYVPIPWLMQRYERCWDPANPPQPQEAALVFAILALGDLVSNNSSSWFLISASVQLLRISNFFASPSMDSIHTFCYIAVYLQHEGKLGEYWPLLGLVIRLAQSMALHRDPSLILNLSSEEGELRRRLFWTVAAQETALSLMFGRPNGIGFTDCKLPKDISDDELFGEQAIEGMRTSSNEISYNRYTWELGAITREMLEGPFQDKDTDSMSRIKALESRIWAWFHSLPLRFRFDPNAKQPEDFDSPGSKTQYVQSVLLYIIVHHNILVLFRKPLLSHMSPGSRKPCFEAAFALADSWKILQDSFPKVSLNALTLIHCPTSHFESKMARVTWMHWFRAFHAALICLVVIRTDGPRSEFRSRALTCWMSCLRIFARINDQNGSIMSCWRALSRLDVVVRKEMNAERLPKRYSNHKQLRDSSSQLLISSPGETRAELNPFSPTIQEPGWSAGSIAEVSPLLTTGICPENTYAYASHPHAYASSAMASNPEEPQVPVLASAVDPSLDTNLQNGSGSDLSGSIFGTQELDIFDMDVQNWPSWLTDQHSPELP